MPLDSTAITVLLVIVVILHIAVPVVVLVDRATWPRKLVWMLVVCSVPLLGPLYYLLFRHEWCETAATTAKGTKDDPR